MEMHKQWWQLRSSGSQPSSGGVAEAAQAVEATTCHGATVEALGSASFVVSAARLCAQLPILR